MEVVELDPDTIVVVKFKVVVGSVDLVVVTDCWVETVLMEP